MTKETIENDPNFKRMIIYLSELYKRGNEIGFNRSLLEIIRFREIEIYEYIDWFNTINL